MQKCIASTVKRNQNSTMKDFNPKKTALQLALKKMFTEPHFNICTIDSCLKLTGSIPSPEIYKIMRSVHCVNFMDMPEDFRQWVFENTIAMFQNNGFDLNKFEVLDNETATIYLPK